MYYKVIVFRLFKEYGALKLAHTYMHYFLKEYKFIIIKY